MITFYRYQATTLPPSQSNWKREVGITPIPYQDEITLQRCWLNPSGGIDKDMFAASSLSTSVNNNNSNNNTNNNSINGNGKDNNVSTSHEDHRQRVTPLDLRLTGELSHSASKWSTYAPTGANSPARDQLFGPPPTYQQNIPQSGTLGIALQASGGYPSLSSSPTSSITSIERSTSTSFRNNSHQNNNNHPHRELNAGYVGRVAAQAQSQWYHQHHNNNDDLNSTEDNMVVGSYRDTRPKQIRSQYK